VRAATLFYYMKNIVITQALWRIPCSSITSKDKEEVTNYTVTNPMRIDTSFTKQYVSKSSRLEILKFEHRKRLPSKYFYVDEGQYVKEQILFRIMPKCIKLNY
jgi:membrane fusion protein (multidrug efflux system)